MPRRIEVELTSSREDGTWTWRAAGAKQPKGELNGSLLYPGAKVGDVVRADADFFVDGITVVAVLAPKEKKRTEPERIEIVGSGKGDEQLVTSTLVSKGGRGGKGDRPRRDRDDGPGRGDRRDRSERGPRPERNDRGRPERAGGAPRGDGRDRPAGDRPSTDRPRRPRPERPAPEAKPKAPRLKAGRTYRTAVLAELPEEQKPIAEQMLRGGLPAVRQAVDKQNEANREAGRPEINPAPLMGIAEQLLPRIRTAEWRDKAEAALAQADQVDLRDLRSVVVAAEQAARDDETRALAEQIRAALNQRVESEHTAWLGEVDEMLREGRLVRALRISSRPPKAGAPFPAELATKLSEATAANLTAETGSERYATVLDALAFAPVRTQVTAQSIPEKPSDELLAAVKKLASRLPQIATQFGIDPNESAPRGARRPRSGGRAVPAPPPPPPPPPPVAESAPVDAPVDPPVETAEPDAPVVVPDAVVEPAPEAPPEGPSEAVPVGASAEPEVAIESVPEPVEAPAAPPS